MIIKAKQFIIRPFKKQDEADYAKYANNKKVAKNMLRLPYPFTAADARKRIKNFISQYKKKNPQFITLAIEIDREAVGWISANHFTDHSCSIGYWLAEKHWGKGLMTKIVKKFIAEIFKKYKLKRIEAHVYDHNISSMRVLEKCGFQKEGVLRKKYVKNSKYLDAHVYSKLK